MHVLRDTLRKLTDSRWINLFEVECRHESGRQGTWHFVSRKAVPPLGAAPLAPDAVFIVPIVRTAHGNRLVVIREFRVALGDFELSCPAGLIDPGETIEEAVRRELKEETGLELTRILAVSPPVVSSAGMSDESAVVTIVECSGEPDTAGLDGSEEIEILVIDYDQLCALHRSPVTFSAKAWLVLQLFEFIGKIAWPET